MSMSGGRPKSQLSPPIITLMNLSNSYRDSIAMCPPESHRNRFYVGTHNTGAFVITPLTYLLFAGLVYTHQTST
jgi:hypothetical protein